MIELFNQKTNRFTTPRNGSLIYATNFNITIESGAILGTVKKVKDGIITFFDGEGHQSLIWRFPDGSLNNWVEYGA